MKSDVKRILLEEMLKGKNIIATRYYTESAYDILKDEIIFNPNNALIQNNITYFILANSEIEIHNNIKECYIEFRKYQDDKIIYQILYYEIQS